ncbi:hypothetical protein [Azospirillum sp. B506]|nr:hypothetical protein [Azospirillum sp. B506]
MAAMVQLDNDCFAFGGPMMAMEPALALLAGRVGPSRRPGPCR